MYFLKFETKIVQIEPLVFLCSFNSLQISMKAKWSVYREVLSVKWLNFRVVKYDSKICNIYYYIKFRKSIINRWSIKKLFLKNFAIFTGNHLCWSHFFNENLGLQSCSLIKKRLQHRCFPVNITKFLRIPVLKTSMNGCLNVFLHE